MQENAWAAIQRFEFDLLPDEDWLEQSNRGHDGLPDHFTLEERTEHYRERIAGYQGSDAWQRSLAVMGTCCHYGDIHPRAISQVIVTDGGKQSSLLFSCLDVSKTTLNLRVLAEHYKAIVYRIRTGEWPSIRKEFDLC